MAGPSLTRIKNNQITDSTIWANAKIVPGSIVGSLFNSNITVTSDFTITGNLTVQGASTYLTVASTNTYVNDPLIVLNNAFSGTNTYDLGFVFNRGSLQNTALIWNEFNKEFRLVGTTETGTTYGNINQSSFANLRVGNLNVQYATTVSTFSASTLNVSGNVLTGLLQAAAINSTPIGNATPSTATFTYVTTGNVLSGFIGNTGTAFTGASLNVTGNILVATINSTTENTSTVNAGAVNAVTIGNTGATVQGTTAQFTGNVIGGLASFASINNTPIGNATASTGAFTTLSAANNLYANASIATTTQGTGAIVVPNGGISVAGAANIGTTLTVAGATQLNSTLGVGGIASFTNTTNATEGAGSSGALQIKGGVSIAQDLWVGGNLYAANIVGVTANVITVQDPLLYLRPASIFPYNYDIGIYSGFQGTGLTTAGNIYQHTAVFRDPLTNTWTFASNLAEPSASYITLDGTTVYDPIKAGNLQLTVTTDSTNATTGALIVAGGAGIGGNIFQTGTRHETSSTNFLLATTPTTVDAFKAATTLNVGANSGTLTIGNPTLVGTQTTQNLYNTTATTLNFAGAATALTVGAATGYAAVQNANLWLPNATSIDGTQANVSIFATNATQAQLFTVANISIGASVGTTTINNPTINVSASSLTFANTVATTVNAFGAATTLNLGSGVASMATVRGRFRVDSQRSNGNSLDGALRVVGTTALGSNLFVGNGAVINDLQTSEQFKIRGTGSSLVFFVDPGTQTAVINGVSQAGNTATIPGATFAVRSNDAFLMPVGSTAQRPGNSGNVDIQGMLRYNTSAGNMEWYNGTSWQTPGASTTVIQDQQINGDGTTTTFAVNNATTTNATIVSVNGVLQLPTISYAMVSGNIVFTEAPATGDVIDVRSLTTTTTVTSISSSNGFAVFDVSNPTNSYANIQAGTSSAVTRVSVAADGIVGFVNGAKLMINQTAVNIAANATPYVVDTFTQTLYGAAKYVIKAQRGTGATGNIEAYEAMVVTDGAGSAYVTVYGVINNGYTMGQLSANVLGGNVQLYYTGVNAAAVVQANVKTYTTYIV